MPALPRFHLRARLSAYRVKLLLGPLRTADRLAVLCLALLDAEVRNLKPDVLQVGEDKVLDSIVEYVTRQLLGFRIDPELEPVASKDLVFELLDLAQKSSDVQNVVSRYHAAIAFYSRARVEEGKPGQLVLVNAAVPGFGPVHQEYRKTKARYVSLRKQLAERSAIRFHFSVAGISSSIALITAIFLVSGFLYVNYFYKRMGVEVSNYFSAADYLAVSVEQIRSGAIAAALSLVTFSAGVLSGTRRSRLQIQAEAPDRNRRRTFWWVTTAIGLVVCVVSLYMDQPHVDQPRLLLFRGTGYLLCFFIAEYVSDKFFTNTLAAMTAIVGTLLFGLNVALSAYERSELLLNGRDESSYLQKLTYKDQSPAISGELYGANSSFYFLYDRSKKVTHIVPRDRVSQIDIAKRDATKDPTVLKKQERPVAPRVNGPDQGFY